MPEAVTTSPSGSAATVVETAAPQPVQQPVVEQPAAAMGTEQTAAIAHLAVLRKEASDPALSHEKRGAIMQKLSELSKHAFLGDKAPSWYGAKTPDARATSNELHDPLSEALGGGTEKLTVAEIEHLIAHGKVKGMDAQTAQLAADFCVRTGMDKTVAKILVDRQAHHASLGKGMATQDLTREERSDLFAEASSRFGSVEKYQAANAMARAYIEHVGMGAWVDKYAGSLAYDPHVLSMLSLKAKQIGLKPAK